MIALVLVDATATPPTIVRERVSPVCSTLHQVVIPLAQMNLKNLPILENVRGPQAKLAQARRTYLGDGVFLYASQIDQAFSNIIQNIHEVDRSLLKSYAAYPQGQNTRVDALRQRAQNVLDLERAMANARAASFADQDPRLAGNVAGYSLRMLKWTGFPQLQSLLHREGPALEAQTLIAARDCDGV